MRPVLERSPRLAENITDAARFVVSYDWKEWFGVDHGACIPISYYTAQFLRTRGIAATPIEAAVRVVDPMSKRYAELTSGSAENPWEAADEKGHPFLGHLVVHVPTFRAVFDLSLTTQTIVTLRSELPDVLAGNYDHTQGHVGFQVKLGRGVAIYRVYPRRNGWRKRDWPWATIQRTAEEDANQ